MKYKNCLIYVLAVIMLNGCAATKNNLNVLYTEKQLLKDIDFVHRKLQKLHPQLYWYISKKALDEKFDSLKSSIRAPMTADEFYFKLSPVVSSIRQGHTRLFRNTKSDQKGSGFEYEIFDHKLYIVKNYSARADIKPGTEVVSINNTSPQAILEKYGNTFSSDGFNQTFKDRILCQTFEKSLSFENIRPDSVVYQLKYNDTIRNVSLYNTTSDSVKTTKNIQAYDTDLKFMGRDSSVALMKISSLRDFTMDFTTEVLKKSANSSPKF